MADSRRWIRTALARVVEQTRYKLYRRRLASLGPGTWIAPSAKVVHPEKVHLGSGVRIHEMVYINGQSDRGVTIDDGCDVRYGAYIDGWKGVGIEIGSNCFVGPFAVIQGQGGVSIGDNCLIAGHTYIVSASHVFDTPSIPIRKQGETAVGVKIGSDVWLGAGSIVLDGVEVGDGCVIGAGSVVTRSLPSMSVAYGAPAKVRRVRGQ